MSETSLYEEEQLTKREHLDPSIHLMGETLPIPSLDDIRFAGTETAVGDSPFPARADHQHDYRTRWTGIRSSNPAVGKVVGAGATVFLDDLAHVWGDEDFLNAGFPTQLIDIPQEGIWTIYHRIKVVRSAATFPAATPYELVFKYNNAAFAHVLRHDNYPQGLGDLVIEVNDEALYSSVSASSNLQIEFTNGDAVSVNVITSILMVKRTSSFEGPGEL